MNETGREIYSTTKKTFQIEHDFACKYKNETQRKKKRRKAKRKNIFQTIITFMCVYLSLYHF